MSGCTSLRFVGAIAFSCAFLLSACGGGGSDGGMSPPAPLPPGTLDASFGTNGIVQTLGVTFSATSVVLQPDGKIVAAGSKNSGELPNVTASFVVVRYAPNGSLDSGFGGGGTVTTPIESGSALFADLVYSAALQSDGKIVVAGVMQGVPSPTSVSKCVLIRYNVDGALDTSFGTGGKVLIDRAPFSCTALAIQADGKILVAGLGFVAIRLDVNGSLDTSFGVEGQVSPAQSCFGNFECYPGAILIQSDGRIVLAGTSSNTRPAFFYSDGSSVITRYDANGALDAGFGDAGVVRGDNFVWDSGRTGYGGAVLQPDGKTLIAINQQGYWRNARFNVDGSVDTGFQKDGLTVQQFRIFGGALLVQPNGKYIAAGSTYMTPAVQFLVARFNPNGIFDLSFGGGGPVITPIGSYSYATAAVVQRDGRIVIVGGAKVSDQDVLALARYYGDPAQ